MEQIPKPVNLGRGVVLVVPLWNEYSRGSFSYLDGLVSLSEIDFVFVNDGSTDRTLIELQRYSYLSNVRIIDIQKNAGKTQAIKRGFKEVANTKQYEMVGFLDGDGAFEIGEVKRCIQVAEQKISKEDFDVFCTSRVALSGHKIERNPRRHILGRIIRTLIQFRHKHLPYDTQSGFKIFSPGESFEYAINQNFKTKWFVDLEIILELRHRNPDVKIWEEPLLAWRDIEKSSITYKSIIRVVSEIISILRIKP